MIKELPVKISDRALQEIIYIIKEKNIPPDYFLRVGIKGTAGCSGVSFVIGFDKMKANDNLFNYKGISILIEKPHTMFLIGTLIDFEESVEERGFIFSKT